MKRESVIDYKLVTIPCTLSNIPPHVDLYHELPQHVHCVVA